jgi:hypothetical protein
MKYASNSMFNSATVALTTLLAANVCALAETIEVGIPDCSDCAIDVFPPDLSGEWSEFCSVFKKTEHTLKFKHIGGNYMVIDGTHRCILTDIVDYNKLERRYIVRTEQDCTARVPEILISEFSLNQDNRLELTSKQGKRMLVDCARGVQ